MTLTSLMDYVAGLWKEVVGDRPPCVDEIAAQDERIESKMRQAKEILENPNTPKETIDAATVCLDSITLDFRKMKGEAR